MAKLTQFGRMRRRIKRELDAARTERALSYMQMGAMMAAGAASINLVRSAVVLKKMKEYPDGSVLVSSQGLGPSGLIAESLEEAVRKLKDLHDYETAGAFVKIKVGEFLSGPTDP